MNHLGDYDVIVIGAGHAGIEAAHAAATLGARTAVFTMSLDAIGNMPCNPSIGGTAKGTLVRELDALGGVMGLAADATYLQSRMLNKGKGPAVHALRVQTDRKRYHMWMKHALEKTPNLDIHQAEIGMQFGPSLTVNPVHHLKIGGYFRVTPSYSLLYMDETVHHHYVTFCNAGCTLAWKVLSVGVEWRWGTAKYDGLKFDESAFDEDDLTDGDADLFAALERTALVGQVVLACTDAQDGEAWLYAVFLQFFRLCMEPLGQRLGDLGSLEQHSHGKNSSSDRRGHPRSYP